MTHQTCCMQGFQFLKYDITNIIKYLHHFNGLPLYLYHSYYKKRTNTYIIKNLAHYFFQSTISI